MSSLFQALSLPQLIEALSRWLIPDSTDYKTRSRQRTMPAARETVKRRKACFLARGGAALVPFRMSKMKKLRLRLGGPGVAERRGARTTCAPTSKAGEVEKWSDVLLRFAGADPGPLVVLTSGRWSPGDGADLFSGRWTTPDSSNRSSMRRLEWRRIPRRGTHTDSRPLSYFALKSPSPSGCTPNIL
jgi:hypothetical protein